MAKTTVAFGALLILLGAGGYIMTGSDHPTALIPMWFGIVLCLCGILAHTQNPKRRMLWMHIAVTMATIGFLGAAVKIVMSLVRSSEIPINNVAIGAQAAMTVLCLVFVGLCVRSFIAARRNPEATA
jgi:hypothetical protein